MNIEYVSTVLYDYLKSVETNNLMKAREVTMQKINEDNIALHDYQYIVALWIFKRYYLLIFLNALPLILNLILKCVLIIVCIIKLTMYS